MKRELFVKGLNKVLPATNTRGIVEEYATLRFKGDSIVTSNGLVMIRTNLGFDSGIDGLVPADRFFKLLSDLKDDNLTVKQKESELSVVSGRNRARYKIKPREGGFLDTLNFDIDKAAWRPWPKDLDKFLQLCKFAASQDASRGGMCGVHVSSVGAMATDSYRIASVKTVVGACDEKGVTLSLETLDVLSKQTDELTAWAVVGDTVYFDLSGKTTIGAKLLTGDYPDAAQFLAQTESLKSEVAFPEAVRDAIRRHGDQMADLSELDREVTVALDGKKLTITSTDGVLYTLDEDLDMENAPEGKLSFKVNPSFLVDILSMTRKMKCEAGKQFVAFINDNFTYLTTVEWVK